MDGIFIDMAMYHGTPQHTVNSVNVGGNEKSAESVTLEQSTSVSAATNSETLGFSVELRSNVLEHLQRDNNTLRNKIKMFCSVDMTAFLDKTGSCTFVQFNGTSEELLLEAQRFLWEDVLPLQKRKKEIYDTGLKVMWEYNWNREDRIAFINQTNVQIEFKTGHQVVLSGFNKKQLVAAANLLVEHHESETHPQKENYEKARQDAKQKDANDPKLGNNTFRGPPVLSNVEEQISFSMVIQHPVVRLINKENCLKNEMSRKFGLNIACFENPNNANHTTVELIGDSGSILDAEYDVFLYISQLQTHTERIRENNVIQMWKTWNKRDKVLFFLETNTFITDDTNIVRGFQKLEVMNAKAKLKEYSESGEKPLSFSQNIKECKINAATAPPEKVASMSAATVSASLKTKKSRQQGARVTIKIEVEKGKEKRVAELFTSTDMKKMQDKYKTKVNTKTSAGLVVVNLTAEFDANITKVEGHIWKTLRAIQEHQRAYFLTDNHGWKLVTEEEKNNFMTRTQVTVEEDGYKLLLKGFLLSKLASAVDKLDAKKDKNGKSVITLELKDGTERRIGGILIGTQGAETKALRRTHETTARIVSSPGLIVIELSAKDDETVYKAEKHIWKRLRSLQNEERENPINAGHPWRKYTKKERIQFQTETQVSIEFDESNKSKLILKAFLKEKLRLAVAQLG